VVTKKRDQYVNRSTSGCSAYELNVGSHSNWCGTLDFQPIDGGLQQLSARRVGQVCSRADVCFALFLEVLVWKVESRHWYNSQSLPAFKRKKQFR
jgi:hypothetical protein